MITWDIIIALVTLVEFATLPLIIAFSERNIHKKVSFALWVIADIFFILDYVIMLFRVVLNHGTKKKDGLTIQKWYEIFWTPSFYIDTVATYPASFAAILTCGFCTEVHDPMWIRLLFMVNLLKIRYVYRMVDIILGILMLTTFGDLRRITNLSLTLFLLI